YQQLEPRRMRRALSPSLTEAGDPVATELIASLPHPGGHVTGVCVGGGLPRKRLQLLKEMYPAISHVGVLYNPTFPATRQWIKDAQAVASTLAVKILAIEARTPEELDKAFASLMKSGGDSLLTLGDPFTSNRQSQILSLTAK